MSKRYSFTLPVSGYECFEVIADSIEDALDKLKENSYEYKVGDDIEFSQGISEDYLDSEEELD